MASTPVNPFETLGVDPDSDTEEIRIAYRSAARRHHPDRGGDPAAFAHVTGAYRMLRNRDHRTRLRNEWSHSDARATEANSTTRRVVVRSEHQRMVRLGVLAALASLFVFSLIVTWSAAGPSVFGLVVAASCVIGCAAVTLTHLTELRARRRAAPRV